MAERLLGGRRALLTAAVLLIALGLCGLGLWQWGRHQQRAALNERILARLAEPPATLGEPLDPEQLEYRRVQLSGTLDSARSVLLRNRAYEGATGYHLITPLRLDDGRAVLVDRGWVPYSPDPGALLAELTSGGDARATVDGVVRRSEAGNSGPPDPPLSAARPRLEAWFRVDVARIAEQSGYPLLPIFVEQQPGPQPPAGPPIPAATTDLGQGPHLGYSFQWFAFAAILIVGYGVVMLRRPAPADKRGTR